MEARLIAAATLLCCAASLQAKDIKIAHVYDKSGALEAYAKQTQTGLMMGLEYATGGTMKVNGNNLVVIEKDNQGKPDVGKAQLAAVFADDKADIAVGPTSSGVALAMLPVAEEYKKILLVEPAVADAITGDKWNRYIFRTGRNSSQDAIANAVALDKAGITIATMAQATHYDPGMVRQFFNFPDDYVLDAEYDSLDMPVLVLRGEKSDLLAVDTAQDMTQREPRASLLTIAGCGHAPCLNVPQQIDPVARFLQT